MWKNSDATSASSERLFIDAFNRGTRLTRDEVAAQDHEHQEISHATPIEVSSFGCVFCSTILLLASTRWVRSTFLSLRCPHF